MNTLCVKVESDVAKLLYNKNKHSFCKFSALWPLSSKKKNDNNDNLCKIHGGLYIASALMKTTMTS